MSLPRLKSCPCCGGGAEIVYDDIMGRYRAECPWCGMRSPGMGTPGKAADLWSRICERLEEGVLE